MDIIQVFEQLGLKEDHSKVYEASLEWGETTVSNLSYKSKLPRTTVYLYLEDLIEIGLIKMVLRKGKKNYVASDPEILVKLLEDEKNDVDRLIQFTKGSMTQLKSIQNNKKEKPKVHYFEGADGIKQAYNLSLEAKGEVCIQCYSSNYEEIIKDDFFDNYFEKFFALDVPSRELITDTEGDEEYAKRWGSEKNLHMLVDITKIRNEIETDLMIFDQKVIFVSFDLENPYALMIEDKSIFDAMKSLYELSWNEAIRSDKRILRGEKIRTEYGK